MAHSETLPLFPLQMVLFPGVPIQLHIFEDRYVQMLDECLTRKQPFGIILIKEGQEAHGLLANTFDIGCSVDINAVTPMEGNRYHLRGEGGQRFRVDQMDRESHPYLAGQVAWLPSVSLPQHDTEIDDTLESLKELVHQYTGILGKLDALPFPVARLSREPSQFLSQAAALTQPDLFLKQRLLEESSGMSMLNLLIRWYTREVAIIQSIANQRLAKPRVLGPFSQN